MDLDRWVAPATAGVIGALCAARWMTPRPGGRWQVSTSWQMAVAALLGMSSVLVAVRLGMPLGRGVPRLAIGLAVLAGGAFLAHSASRLHTRAHLLHRHPPLDLDEAIARLSEGEELEGVFRGRIAASGQVTSPGGIVGAFYEAELHALSEDGSAGALLSCERGSSRQIHLEGTHSRADVVLGPESLVGPVQVRKCHASLPVTQVEPVPAEGPVPAEVVSLERVGKLGQPCLVAGRLKRATDAFTVKGVGGNPVLLVLSPEGALPAGAFARKAWGFYAAALGLSIASAFFLAHAAG